MTACSSPLGAWLAGQWPDVEPCCQRHDEDYGQGGDEKDRLIADMKFLL